VHQLHQRDAAAALQPGKQGKGGAEKVSFCGGRRLLSGRDRA
jgi:hypothetical protein